MVPVSRADARRSRSRRASTAIVLDAGAADPVVGDRAGGRPLRRAARTPRRRAARTTRASVRRAVGGVEMTVRAEVAARRDADRGRAGAASRATSCASNAPADGGITLYADKVPVHTRPPGPRGRRRAVQVTGPRRRRPMSADDALIGSASPPAEAVPSACSRCSPPGKVSIGEVAVVPSDANRARRRPRAGRRHVGLLRRRRHRRQRLRDDARRRAQPRRGDDGHGRARGPGRAPSSSELELSAVVRGDEPDDGLGRGRDVARARHRGRDRHARDARPSRPADEAPAPTRRRRTPSATAIVGLRRARAGSSSSSRTRSSCA